MRQRVPAAWSITGRQHHPLRLLIEDDDPVLPLSDFEAYREAGIEVALCSGPTAGRDECPPHHGRECTLLSEADVVLRHLDTSTGLADYLPAWPGRPPVLTVGGPAADIPENAPVPSRIRAVMREGNRRPPSRVPSD